MTHQFKFGYKVSMQAALLEGGVMENQICVILSHMDDALRYNKNFTKKIRQKVKVYSQEIKKK